MRDDTATTSPEGCDHELRTWGRTGVIACPECGLVEWFGTRGPIDPAEGMAALFGSYDLIGPMPAVGAPTDDVLAYRPSRGRRGALDVLPRGAWMRATSDIWLATDGLVLLLGSPDRLLMANLTEGA